MKVKALLAAIALMIAGCAGPLIQPTQADADRAHARYETSNLASLQLGRTVYSERCGGCHKLYRPNTFSEKKWLHEIPEMAVKANLSSREKQLVEEYILTMREAK